jgi:hypothetical protein
MNDIESLVYTSEEVKKKFSLSQSLLQNLVNKKVLRPLPIKKRARVFLKTDIDALTTTQLTTK